MKVEVLWKGPNREWAVVNMGGQIIRDSFKDQYAAYEWAVQEQYSVQF